MASASMLDFFSFPNNVGLSGKLLHAAVIIRRALMSLQSPNTPTCLHEHTQHSLTVPNGNEEAMKL